MKQLIKELKLTKKQLKDKDIQNFLLQVAYRKQIGDWVQYLNGNGYCELNKNNGTMITTILNDNEEFEPEFPLNMDCNISNRCQNACTFCYQGCTINGKEANIKKYLDDKNSFLYSLHEGTELAINGNEPLHPDLPLLLEFCKERNVFANLTVRENTLLQHQSQIESWLKNGLIHGIGISPSEYSLEMIQFCQEHPTAVIHTIAGITTIQQYKYLADKKLKILILGYKNFGKGVDYKKECFEMINGKLQDLKKEVKWFPEMFKVVSFDNLAIEQLDVKDILTEKEWDTFYRGDDGKHTCFIDLVEETFAKNSIQPKENHHKLLKDVRDMLKVVRGEK